MPDKLEVSRMQKIRISVVTVCLNTADTIRETVESVLGQTYNNLEYVIVDGMSTDGTLEIIREYESKSGIKSVSSKDSGIYNAMNKGTDLCSGDYILFLNSGDIFVDKHAVENVVAQICDDGSPLPDVIYGNVTKIYADKTVTEKYPGKHRVFKLLMMGKMPCHQGIFAQTSIMRKLRFDESYRICADFDFLLRCVREHVRMQYVDVNVSVVDCVTGISSQKANLDRMRAEDDRSIREHYPLLYYLMRPLKAVVRMRR
ncbi:MAG: glycosyltransferase [Lachnospiraceae bacterium]|nr:glycosyltransferase [Lachnospiraceae bacterium]